MSALNIFRKKEKKEPPKPVKEEKPKKEVIPEKKPVRIKEKRENQGWQVLKAPQITEKATDLAEKNQYVFKVFSRANKTEVKRAVEGLYGVDVLSVNMVKVQPKKRRMGRISGWRPGYKKAIVRVKEGQKIEVLPR
jgi:large subunit ribosomal protein L23